jgi:hypothetical protein
MHIIYIALVNNKNVIKNESEIYIEGKRRESGLGAKNNLYVWLGNYIFLSLSLCPMAIR